MAWRASDPFYDNRPSLTGDIVCDFETRASDEAIKERVTWVHQWSITKIGDIECSKYGNSIESFIQTIHRYAERQGENFLAYFHNIGFDGIFLLYHLLEKGFEYCEDKRKMGNKQFTCLYTDDNQLYSIAYVAGWTKKTQTNGKRKEYWKPVIVEFRDSMKKINFSVAKIAKDYATKYKKLDYEYTTERKPGEEMKPEEIEYVLNDTRIIAEALSHFYERGFLKMTIASEALGEFKNLIGGEKKFRKLFPKLDYEVDKFMHSAYKGGWCYTNPLYADKTYLQKGRTYDVNSLYPSMMSSEKYRLYGMQGIQQNRYPIGEPVYFTGEYQPNLKYPLFIARVHIRCALKKDHLPVYPLRGGRFASRANLFLEVTPDDGMELTVTSVDLEEIKYFYDIETLEMIDGYMFQSIVGVFDQYIDKFMEEKKVGKGAKRAVAKLFLNSLYGKFAQSTEGSQRMPVLDEDGNFQWVTVKSDERDPVYTPVAAFVTAYSRRFTTRAAQANYKRFIYADTDSIHIFDDADPDNVEVHDSDLCRWKHESTWDAGRFVRAKTYAELIDGKWDIKCAGMTQACKDYFIDCMEAGTKSIDNFTYGLIIDGKKLRKQVVKGGILLIPTVFQIHKPKEGLTIL